MSLDVYLTVKRPEPTDADKAIVLLRANGFDEFAEELSAHHETGDEQVYNASITHNVTRIADAAGIYQALWHPEEIGVTKAGQLIPLLAIGLANLRADPARFKALNPENGWGSYAGFVPWVARYLCACQDDPEAEVSVSR